MRVMFILTAAAAAIFLAPASGHAYEGPWCAVQSTGLDSVVENCRVRTFEECRQETIAGNRGFCTPNARWQGGRGVAVEQPRRPRKRHARHH
jgi:Protein of unknown function (DUF3551)